MTGTHAPVTQPPARVRQALPSDEEEIMDICRDLHHEIGLFPLSDDRVRVLLRRAFNGHGGILGVIGEPGKIEGTIYLHFATAWYSDREYLAEYWNYVLPEYRFGDNSKSLLSYAKYCAYKIGIPLLIGVSTDVRLEAKNRLYRRQLGEGHRSVYFIHTPVQQEAI